METKELSVPALADRCPFSRVFGPEFDDCVAYTAEEFTALDTGYRPLRPVLTCRNLAIGTDATGGFYPRCSLGTAENRARWAHDVGPERLRELHDLSVEYRTWVSGVLPQVWEAKGRLLALRAEHRDTKIATQEMQERVTELLAAADEWIDAHAERISAVGVDPAVLKSLITTATRDWVESPHAGLSYQVPDYVLEQFPPQLQTFVRAGRA